MECRGPHTHIESAVGLERPPRATQSCKIVPGRSRPVCLLLRAKQEPVPELARGHGRCPAQALDGRVLSGWS